MILSSNHKVHTNDDGNNDDQNDDDNDDTVDGEFREV